jgi:ABC-type nitrate/sulfonate/bicarbonate transport system ATPase subunit
MPDLAYLRVQAVTRTFDSGGGSVTAIRDVDFTVNRGSFLSILGPSGCGKSTLFNMIAGLLTPTSGDVLLDGHSIVNHPGQVGYMLQKDLLMPWRSIEDNITLGQTLQGMSRAQARTLAAPLIKRCGLHGFEHSRPWQLSGGMRQRAALMRTLLTGQDLLLLDEPFGALDAITRLQLQLLLSDVWQEMHKTILFVTHDVDEALLLSDEILLLSARPGRVIRRFHVDMPRPRIPAMLAESTVAAQKAEIMDLLWKEVAPHDENR